MFIGNLEGYEVKEMQLYSGKKLEHNSLLLFYPVFFPRS